MGNVININFRSGKPSQENSNEVANNTVQKVICNSPEVKEIVVYSLARSNWKYKHFSYFIKSIGLKTPITLCKLVQTLDYNSIGRIKCITNDRKVVYIDCYDNGFECNFTVSVDNEVTGYILRGMTEENQKMPPIYAIEKNIIVDSSKTLKMDFWGNFDWTLELEGGKSFSIALESSLINEKYITIGNTAKMEEVNNYILNLSNYSDTFKVCADILKIFGFSKEEIKEKISMIISDNQSIGTVKISCNRLVIDRNTIQQYVTSNGNEKFNVCLNGSWGYSGKGILISSSWDDESIDFTLTGGEEYISSIKPNEVLAYVKENINNYRKVFENDFIENNILNLID